MLARNIGPLTLALAVATARVGHAQERDLPPAVAIRFPPMMRSANVEGTVDIAVRVDSAGRPLRETTRIISATHELFAQAAKNGVARWAIGPYERAVWLRGDTLVVMAEFLFADSKQCPPSVLNNFRGTIPPLPPAREALSWDGTARRIRVRITSCHETRMMESIP